MAASFSEVPANLKFSAALVQTVGVKLRLAAVNLDRQRDGCVKRRLWLEHGPLAQALDLQLVRHLQEGLQGVLGDVHLRGKYRDQVGEIQFSPGQNK